MFAFVSFGLVLLAVPTGNLHPSLPTGKLIFTCITAPNAVPIVILIPVLLKLL